VFQIFSLFLCLFAGSRPFLLSFICLDEFVPKKFFSIESFLFLDILIHFANVSVLQCQLFQLILQCWVLDKCFFIKFVSIHFSI
jgi:hypothetical protein